MNYLVIAIALISFIIVFFIAKKLIRLTKKATDTNQVHAFTQAQISELTPIKENIEYIDNIYGDNYFIGYNSLTPVEEIIVEEDIEEEEFLDCNGQSIFTEFSDIDLEYFGAIHEPLVTSYSLIDDEKAVLTGFDEDTSEYIFQFIAGSRLGQETRLVNISNLDVIPAELLLEP